MPATSIPIRVASDLVEAIDSLASAAGTSRAEALGTLVKAALDGPPVPAHDPLLDQIAEAVGTLLARADAILEAGRSAKDYARAAYTAAYGHALAALPATERKAFVAKVAEKLA